MPDRRLQPPEVPNHLLAQPADAVGVIPNGRRWVRTFPLGVRWGRSGVGRNRAVECQCSECVLMPPLRSYTRPVPGSRSVRSGHSLCSIAPPRVPQPGPHCPRGWPAKSLVGYTSSASSRARAVGGVGPHITGSVVTVEHCAELATIVRRRIGHRVAPQKAVRAVDADVVFVAEHRHGDLDLPLLVFARASALHHRAAGHPTMWC